MSEIKLNPVFDGFNKKLGNIVFYKKNGKLFSRKAPSPRKKESDSQVETRLSFLLATAVWRGIKGIAQTSWKLYGKNKNQSGYNSFMERNISRVRKNIPLSLSEKFGLNPLENFCAESGRSGEINCTFLLPENSSDVHLYIFTQKKNGERMSDILKRHYAGKNPSGDYTIRGLESGKEHIVYAILTNLPYEAADAASSSVATVVKAG